MTQKEMSPKEFQETGLLQEVNRQFFHPLGLALYLTMDEDDKVVLGGILDSRNDPEGFRFDCWLNPKAKAYVKRLRSQKARARKKLFGAVIQPVKARSKYISKKMRLAQ